MCAQVIERVPTPAEHNTECTTHLNQSVPEWMGHVLGQRRGVH